MLGLLPKSLCLLMKAFLMNFIGLLKKDHPLLSASKLSFVIVAQLYEYELPVKNLLSFNNFFIFTLYYIKKCIFDPLFRKLKSFERSLQVPKIMVSTFQNFNGLFDTCIDKSFLSCV